MTYCSLTRQFQILKDKKIPVLDLEEKKRAFKEFLSKDFCVRSFDYVELCSANPTGKLHLAHCYNAVIGDILSRFTQAKKIYYVNDCGEKFFKFLCGYNYEKTFKENYLEAYTSNYKEDLESFRRSKSKEGLSLEQLRVRDLVVKEQEKDLLELNINVDKYYYESFFQNKIPYYLQRPEVSETPDGFFEAGVRLTTSKGIPLYLLSDLIYRKEISENKKIVQVIGPDNEPNAKKINDMTNLKWDFFIIPAIKKNSEKISSSKKNLFYIEDLKESWFHKGFHDFKNLFRLWVLFTSSSKTLEIPWGQNFKNILLLCNKLKDKYPRSDLESLNFDTDSSMITKLALIKDILHKIIDNKNTNKLFKFLEFLNHSYKTSNKNERIAISLVYNKLLDLIGVE